MRAVAFHESFTIVLHNSLSRHYFMTLHESFSQYFTWDFLQCMTAFYELRQHCKILHELCLSGTLHDSPSRHSFTAVLHDSHSWQPFTAAVREGHPRQLRAAWSRSLHSDSGTNYIMMMEYTQSPRPPGALWICCFHIHLRPYVRYQCSPMFISFATFMITTFYRLFVYKLYYPCVHQLLQSCQLAPLHSIVLKLLSLFSLIFLSACSLLLLHSCSTALLFSY